MNYKTINYELQLNELIEDDQNADQETELINPMSHYEDLIFGIIEEESEQ